MPGLKFLITADVNLFPQRLCSSFGLMSRWPCLALLSCKVLYEALGTSPPRMVPWVLRSSAPSVPRCLKSYQGGWRNFTHKCPHEQQSSDFNPYSPNDREKRYHQMQSFKGIPESQMWEKDTKGEGRAIQRNIIW